MPPRIRFRPKMRGSKYWYYTIYSECVLCGKSDEVRVRDYGTKPPLNKRSEFVQYACDTHFL